MYLEINIRKWWKKSIIPWNNRVPSDPPFILNRMQVGMTNPTIEDLDCDILITIFSANHTNNISTNIIWTNSSRLKTDNINFIFFDDEFKKLSIQRKRTHNKNERKSTFLRNGMERESQRDLSQPSQKPSVGVLLLGISPFSLGFGIKNLEYGAGLWRPSLLKLWWWKAAWKRNSLFMAFILDSIKSQKSQAYLT